MIENVEHCPEARTGAHIQIINFVPLFHIWIIAQISQLTITINGSTGHKNLALYRST